ncbi:MAG: amidohydrolase family protein [Clostridia bacterium]
MSKLDTLFTNAVFHPMTGETDVFTYLGVKNGRIAYTGNTPPHEAVKHTVDFGGRHVYPAMTDSHLHLLYSIAEALTVNVGEITNAGVKPDTLNGVREKLAERERTLKPQKCLIGMGCIPSALKEGRLPDCDMLKSWFPGRKVLIITIDGHSCAMSREMMRAMGIEDGNGILTGEAFDRRLGQIFSVISGELSLGALLRSTAAFTNACASWGILRICALDGNADDARDVPTRLALWLARRLPIDVRLFIQYTDVKRADKLKRVQRTPRIGGCGQWETDGATGTHSAAYSMPYIDTGSSHKPYYTKEELAAMVKAADDAGYAISAHAIGDAAIDSLIDALYALPDSGRMLRIDHFEIPSAHAVALANNRLAIAVQPGYSWIDKRYLHSYEKYLPRELIDMQLPLKKLMDKGVCVCGSSDSPVQPPDPFLQMLGMRQFFVEAQSLSAYEALLTYTANPAKMLGEQSDWGTLEPGKSADFFTMRENLLDIPAEALAGRRAEALYVSGRPFKRLPQKTWRIFARIIFSKAKKI